MSEFITISAKVIPQSKKNAVEQVVMETPVSVSLKIRITAPPVDGKANQAVIDILSDYFSVKKAAVEIIKGHTSRQKIIKVYNPVIKLAQSKLIFE